MCGITGFLEARARPQAAQEAIVAGMAASLAHRGPDDSGVWTDSEPGIALGHRRLAIIDLSPGGHQPMLTADGRYVVSFNGEIYNYADIAERLRQAGVRLRTRSDTEVLIEGFARWGIAETLRLAEGMFALALWDRQQRRLTLARDRLGIKPLYWSRQGGLFLFASELKALHRHPDWRPAIDRDALVSFLRFGYVPAPAAIYRDTYKLSPGMMLSVTRQGTVEHSAYWRLAEVAEQGSAAAASGNEARQLAALEATLRRAVRNEMVSDVPLGAFLSGGVDSSLVVALMQQESARPVRSFTIGFDAAGYDEAQQAKRVAAHLGTEHTELYVEDRTAREAIPNLPVWYDEPFADSSAIPTQLVSRLARRQVTVALSGDGGDELFAGYERYRWARRLGLLGVALPGPLRRAAGGALAALPEAAARGGAALLPRRLRPSQPEQKLQKLAAALGAVDGAALYERIVSLWPEPALLVPGAGEAKGFAESSEATRRFADPVEHMMVLDALTYLPDDILAKVDRASMSVALEVRVPLLNHRVVEAAWRLPPAMKLRRGTSKWALRQILYRHVPRALIERPKQGFSVPLAAWLRGPLREWAEDLLSPAALAGSGWLEPAPILARWGQHRAGRKDWSQSLWAVLMLQCWLAQQAEAPPKLPEAAAVIAG
ncbi:MAG TPA: asparagine synthase (glutamine-hydrolyzing) [Stellaceae bacterium]|nr:asparagine synthase (glutamine-hydrolyzing) [Stellaceae bacterium]